MNKEILSETDKLYHFHEVVDCGSFQAAARKLKTTASRLTYSVNRLEEILKTRILIRSKSGVLLNEDGQRLMSLSKDFFKKYESFYDEVQNKKESTLKLKMGTFTSIAIYFVPQLLKKIKKTDHFSLSIFTGRSQEIFERLLSKDIDIALTVDPPKHNQVISQEIYTDQFGFYLNKRLWVKNINRESLKDFSLLYMPSATDVKGKSLKQYIDSMNFSFKDHFELNSFEIVSEFAKKGLGIALLPTRVAQFHKGQLDLVQIKSLPSLIGRHHFFLSYRKDLDLSQKVISKMIHYSQEIVS